MRRQWSRSTLQATGAPAAQRTPPRCAHAYKPSAIKRAIECGEPPLMGRSRSAQLHGPARGAHSRWEHRRRRSPSCRPLLAPAAASGVRSIEHGNWLDGECADLMLARGAFLVPTTVTYHALRRAPARPPCSQLAARSAVRGLCLRVARMRRRCACGPSFSLGLRIGPSRVACTRWPCFRRREGIAAGMPAELVAKVADAVEQVGPSRGGLATQ